jgi:hypothetical protein
VAGEWIKVRTNLWDDPRITQLCDLTGSAEATVIGGLYWLWATADEHTESGHMPGLSIAAIDRKTGVKGLGHALLTVGWIDDTDGGITINRFYEHNGTSAKNRASTAKRVANHAARTKAELKANALVTTQNEATNAPTVSTPLAREDKRRKEEEPPIPPKGGEQQNVDIEPKRKSAISLRTYLDDCKRSGDKPIPEGHAVFGYATKVGIPDDFLRLHWLEFKDRYTMPDAKRYKSWSTVFHKSVKGNWFRLWYAANDGSYALTTTGLQAQRNHAEAA